MKRSLLIGAILAGTFYGAHAQISQGGLPLSFQTNVNFSNIPVARYANPDWDAYLAQDKEDTRFTKPFLAALYTTADFGFPQSGQMVTLDNGQRVWRGQISIDGAPAIGLLYDRFNLPKGVRLYLSNENHKQVLGAFDAENNDASGTFATDAIQGNTVTVELNIDPFVDINAIELHADKAAVFHRAIEHLRAYAGNQPLDQVDDQLNGLSSTCMVNAICPQGTQYANNRKATVQILIPAGQGYSLCSGTLVNNTGNAVGSCKAYLLTATHCEGTGSVSSTTFNQALTRFNFEYKNCAGTGAEPTSNTMVGLNFVARADYNSNVSTNNIKGDFMLLQMKQAIPSSYDAVLSGWNNSGSIATTVSEPKKFIGFHHPDGDNKKLSYTHQIQSSNLGAANTHWAMFLENSYGSTGSSGSGLFNGDGYLIGQLSIGGNQSVPASCINNAAGQATNIGDYVAYSKFSYVWDYSVNGTADNRKLKPWLDPANTGATTVDAVKSNCSVITTTGIRTAAKDLSDNISVYPNPVTDGNLVVQYNLTSSQDINVKVYDLSGKEVYTTGFAKAQNGNRKLDLSGLSNGMYMVTFSTEDGFASKKIMLRK